jgi:hypothetical protein
MTFVVDGEMQDYRNLKKEEGGKGEERRGYEMGGAVLIGRALCAISKMSLGTFPFLGVGASACVYLLLALCA